MKRFMAVFAVLILLASCAAAQALEPAPAAHAFGDTWSKAIALDASAAYVLDRDGQLFRWDYAGEPMLISSGLPIAQDSLFGQNNYLDLAAEQQAQVGETVNMLKTDEGTLYAINKYTGRIGAIEQGSVHWHALLEENPFLDPAGWERVVTGSTVHAGQAYWLIDYYNENPGVQHWSRLLCANLATGETRLFDGCEAFRLCTYGDKLLLLCQGEEYYLSVFDPSAGTQERLPLTVPAEGALACDPQTDTIYLVTNSGVYISSAGEPFSLVAGIPAEYAGAQAMVTSAGQLAFTGNGLWAMGVPVSASRQCLSVRLHSDDGLLKSLFAQEYPDVLVDWRTDAAMTAADVAQAIRAGDTTDVFSVEVNSGFGDLVGKGFAAPMTNADIVQSVARMYPSLSAPLMEGDSIIAYPWSVGIGTWAVNQDLWDKHFPDQPLPTTWADFFQLMLRFETADNPDGDLFLMNWNCAAMLEQVLSAYIQRQAFLGEAVDFTNHQLSAELAAISAVHAAVEDYDEAEIYWNSEVVGEHSIFHQSLGASTRSSRLWNENALPAFTFAQEDAPLYTGSMRVLIVNPNAAHPGLAQAFVAQLTCREYSVMMDYCLHQDATEPYAQKPYTVTAPMVQAWQQAVQAVHFPVDAPLLADAFLSQARTLLSRYAAGQLPMEMLLTQLNQTARLVESEAR